MNKVWTHTVVSIQANYSTSWVEICGVVLYLYYHIGFLQVLQQLVNKCRYLGGNEQQYF